MHLTLDSLDESQNPDSAICAAINYKREESLPRAKITGGDRYVQDLRVCTLVKCGPIRRMQFWAPPFSSMIHTIIRPSF